MEKVKLKGADLLKVTENMMAYIREVEALTNSSANEAREMKAAIERAAKEKKQREIEDLKRQVQELEAKKRAEYEAAFAIAKAAKEEELRVKREREAKEQQEEQMRMARKTLEIKELEEQLINEDEGSYGSDEGGIDFDNLDAMLEQRAT